MLPGMRGQVDGIRNGHPGFHASIETLPWQPASFSRVRRPCVANGALGKSRGINARALQSIEGVVA